MKAPQKVSKNIFTDLLRRLARLKIWRGVGLIEVLIIFTMILIFFKYF